MNDTPLFDTVAIIGVGLIGGSLARALRAAGACRTIVGGGRDEASLQRAQQLGVIDRYHLDACAAVEGADMVVLAVPLGATRAVFTAIKPGLASHAVLTDVGSAKQCVIQDACAVWGAMPRHFVPGHPLAGAEKSGVEASFATLFYARRVILTPLPHTDPTCLQQVQEMWRLSGARVEQMTPAHHDEILAATSHLPHVLAYVLVETLRRMDESEAIFRYTAGGFRDFTRIAASQPEMWRDICLANRGAILSMLEHYMTHLSDLRATLIAGDGSALHTLFEHAKTTRERLDIS